MVLDLVFCFWAVGVVGVVLEKINDRQAYREQFGRGPRGKGGLASRDHRGYLVYWRGAGRGVVEEKDEVRGAVELGIFGEV